MTLARKWYYTLRGQFYRLGPIRFEHPVGVRTARAAIRKLWRLGRGELREVWQEEELTAT